MSDGLEVTYKANTTKFVSIAGNIGSGKTTVSDLLEASLLSIINGSRVRYKSLHEEVDQNPYFPVYGPAVTDYFSRGLMPTDTSIFFQTQWWYLMSKGVLRAGIPNLLKTQNVSIDRTVFEDVEVFTKRLVDAGLILPPMNKIYQKAADAMVKYPSADLVVYNRAVAPECLKRVVARGRLAEGGITEDFLKELERLYDWWWDLFSHRNKLLVDTSNLDIVRNEAHQKQVLEQIAEKLKDN